MNMYKIMLTMTLLAALAVPPFASAEETEKPMLGVHVSATAEPTAAPTPTPAVNFAAQMEAAGLGDRILLRNMKGDDVVLLQQRLYDLGYYMGKADGIYGKNTVKAVKEFQKDNGLEKVDGKAGPQTISAMFHENVVGRPTPTPEPTAVPTPTPSPTAVPDLSGAPFTVKEKELVVEGASMTVLAGETEGETLYPLDAILTRLGYTGGVQAGSWQYAREATGEEIALITGGETGLCEGAMGSYQGLVFVTDGAIRIYAYGGEAYVTAPLLELVGLTVDDTAETVRISEQ